jgi:hypothetical protein
MFANPTGVTDGLVGVTFNLANANGYPVSVVGITCFPFVAGTSAVSLFFKPTSVNGTPGIVDAAHGWFQVDSPQTVVFPTANVETACFTPSALSLPAGAHYGFFLQIVGTAAMTVYESPFTESYTESRDGVTLLYGGPAGWGGDAAAPTAPTIPQSALAGKITFSVDLIGSE